MKQIIQSYKTGAIRNGSLVWLVRLVKLVLSVGLVVKRVLSV
jgi:hypothetical protein